MQQSAAGSETAISACVRLFHERARGDDLQQYFDRWRNLRLAATRETLPFALRDHASAIAEHSSHCWSRAMAAVVAAD